MSGLLSAEEQLSLVERLRAGDAGAESEFVAFFGARLHTMIAMRIGDREQARDLAQDALLASITALRSGQLREAGRLAAFVYGVGRNIANNYVRRRQAAPVEVEIDAEVHATTPTVDRIEDAQQRALAGRALSVLQPEDRRILTLTLVDGLKPGDIAARLRLSSDVVRQRKSRALKKVIAEVERLSRSRGAGH